MESNENSTIEQIQTLIAYAQDHLSRAILLADNDLPVEAQLDALSAALTRCAIRTLDAQRAIMTFQPYPRKKT